VSEKVKLSELINADSQKKLSDSLTLLESLESVEIKNQDQYGKAIDIQKSIKGALKDIESDRKEIVKPYNDKVGAINFKYRSVKDRLSLGNTTIGNATRIWDQEQLRKKQLEQKKREAEAEEKRRKLEEAAEKEAAKVEKYTEEGRDDLAEKAQARMEDKVEEASTTVAAEIEETKAVGVSYRYDCEVEVIDGNLAIKSLLASPMTAPFVLIDTKGLKKMVKAAKGKWFDIPGIKVIDKSTQVIRS